MSPTISLLALLTLGRAAQAADACDLKNLRGPYGFQLTGDSRISGESKPVASLGRIVLGDDKTLSGASSAMFAGYLLGNPVTGSYEIGPDCTMTWNLRDDSGAYQHFQGPITPDGRRARFKQTDAGAAEQGVLVRAPDRCTPANLRRHYQFAVSGSFVPMVPGDSADEMKMDGVIESDDKGAFHLTPNGPGQPPIPVSIGVDTDCNITMEFALPSAGAVKLRGIVVDDGKEILAIRTDPGWIAPARLIAP